MVEREAPAWLLAAAAEATRVRLMRTAGDLPPPLPLLPPPLPPPPLEPPEGQAPAGLALVHALLEPLPPTQHVETEPGQPGLDLPPDAAHFFGSRHTPLPPPAEHTPPRPVLSMDGFLLPEGFLLAEGFLLDLPPLDGFLLDFLLGANSPFLFLLVEGERVFLPLPLPLPLPLLGANSPFLFLLVEGERVFLPLPLPLPLAVGLPLPLAVGLPLPLPLAVGLPLPLPLAVGFFAPGFFAAGLFAAGLFAAGLFAAGLFAAGLFAGLLPLARRRVPSGATAIEGS